jgi:DNA end-binding protein Ku
MARQLIQQLTDDFDPSKFKDEYHKALKKVIDKKVKGDEIVIPEAPDDEPAQVVDLLEALKQSVAAAKRGEKPSRQTSSSTSRKKTTGGSKKKTTKKKTTARKKTTRRKSA